MQWSIRLNRKLPQNHSNEVTHAPPLTSVLHSSYIQGWLPRVIKIHLKEYKDCWKKTNCSICLSKCRHSAQMNNFLTSVVLLPPAGTSRVTNIISRVNLYCPCYGKYIHSRGKIFVFIFLDLMPCEYGFFFLILQLLF